LAALLKKRLTILLDYDFSTTEQHKNKIERLAYYQIAGGALGVIMLIWLIAQIVTITGLVILIFVLAVGLDIFSIYCGRLLLKGEHDIGLRISTINQALQIFSFALFGFAFKFVAGLCLGIGIDYTNDFKFDFNLTISTFEISINTEHELITLGFNFVAVYVIQYIIRIKDEIEDNKLLQTPQIDAEILTIGQDINNE
jgi:hypothetical protein